MCVSQQYPTLSCSIPVYNFLIDKLEDEYDRRKAEDEKDDDEEDDEDEEDDDVVRLAINKSLEKVKKYYAFTSGLMYTVATGKL